jgi:hypothetical protein
LPVRGADDIISSINRSGTLTRSVVNIEGDFSQSSWSSKSPVRQNEIASIGSKT